VATSKHWTTCEIRRGDLDNTKEEGCGGGAGPSSEGALGHKAAVSAMASVATCGL
jgi:hypothetical protein